MPKGVYPRKKKAVRRRKKVVPAQITTLQVESPKDFSFTVSRKGFTLTWSK